jgi:hypothetical protein
MNPTKKLVLLFVPPLASMLARAEQIKGSALTETEVLRIRDKAICISMNADDAKKMEESRGFRDVDPENCWADWHRLRAQVTGNGFLPKMVLCVLGGKGYPKEVEAILAEGGVEHEFRGQDPRMRKAFEASACRVRPSLDDEEFARIGRHATVLYVLSTNFPASEGPAVSHSFLRLGRRLLEAGGIAMKCESSGIAHSRSRWVELAAQAVEGQKVASLRGAGSGFWSALYQAYVRLPIQSEDSFYTCGMHLLGKPDLIVATELTPANKAVELFDVFAMYLLAECPDGGFASGHTFQASKTAPRFRVVWEQCTDYEEDEFFFNPFGRWRFIAD